MWRHDAAWYATRIAGVNNIWDIGNFRDIGAMLSVSIIDESRQILITLMPLPLKR
jgi:hypothetical protein